MKKHSEQTCVDSEQTTHRWSLGEDCVSDGVWPAVIDRVIAARDQAALDMLVKNMRLSHLFTAEHLEAALRADLDVQGLLAYGGAARFLRDSTLLGRLVCGVMAAGPRRCKVSNLEALLTWPGRFRASTLHLPVNLDSLTCEDWIRVAVLLGIPGVRKCIADGVRAGDEDYIALYASLGSLLGPRQFGVWTPAQYNEVDLAFVQPLAKVGYAAATYHPDTPGTEAGDVALAMACARAKLGFSDVLGAPGLKWEKRKWLLVRMYAWSNTVDPVQLTKVLTTSARRRAMVHAAIETGNRDLLVFLLEELKVPAWRGPMVLAARLGRRDILAYLLSRPDFDACL
jgi:hypothetical protein